MEMLKRSNFVRSGAQTIQAHIMTVWEALESRGWKTKCWRDSGRVAQSCLSKQVSYYFGGKQACKGFGFGGEANHFYQLDNHYCHANVDAGSDDWWIIHVGSCRFLYKKFPKGTPLFFCLWKNNSTLHHNEAWQGVSLIILFFVCPQVMLSPVLAC